MVSVKVLPFKEQIAGEVRPAYFLKAFGKKILQMRIFSFGQCNFSCPYCKRGGQWIAPDGSICSAVDAKEDDLLAAVDMAVRAGEVVRLSGGDPVMYPRLSLKLLQRCKKLGGIGSIAHNGSSPKLAEMLLPYLDFAAIDLKAATPEEFSIRAGIKSKLGTKMLQNSLLVQKILSEVGVLVDVRTCVFSTTTLDDLLRIAEMIVSSGKIENKFWTVRNYKPVAGCSWLPLSQDIIMQYIYAVKARFPELKIGMRANWEPVGFLYF